MEENVYSNYGIIPHKHVCDQKIEDKGGPWKQIISISDIGSKVFSVIKKGMQKNIGDGANILF